MSVVFGDAKVYKKHNSKSIPLRTADDKPVIVAVKNCFSWGIKKNKFGGYQLPLVLTDRSKVLEDIDNVRVSCVDHLIELGVLPPDENSNILKGLVFGETNTTLYAKLDGNTLIRHESKKEDKVDPKKYEDKRCDVHAAIIFESIFISEKTVSLQVKAKEVLILNEKKPEEESWVTMF